MDSELARSFLRVPQYEWRIIGRTCGMFSACRNTRADHWLRMRNVLRVPQYACRYLAARAECSCLFSCPLLLPRPRRIRVSLQRHMDFRRGGDHGARSARKEMFCFPPCLRHGIIRCACGMFSACRNTRADHWLRVRNVLRVPQYACGPFAARAECSPRAAMRRRIIGCACGMLRVPQYARGSLATRADCYPRV